MSSFPNLEPVHCSMSSCNCCFLTCLQVSQKAGKVVWYSHLLKSFPQFVVIYTGKGFGIVNKAEVDVCWNCLVLSMFQQMLAIWSVVPLRFLKPTWISESSRFMYCWSLACRILSITLLECEMRVILYEHLFGLFPVICYLQMKVLGACTSLYKGTLFLFLLA